MTHFILQPLFDRSTLRKSKAPAEKQTAADATVSEVAAVKLKSVAATSWSSSTEDAPVASPSPVEKSQSLWDDAGAPPPAVGVAATTTAPVKVPLSAVRAMPPPPVQRKEEPKKEEPRNEETAVVAEPACATNEEDVVPVPSTPSKLSDAEKKVLQEKVLFYSIDPCLFFKRKIFFCCFQGRKRLETKAAKEPTTATEASNKVEWKIFVSFIFSFMVNFFGRSSTRLRNLQWTRLLRTIPTIPRWI